MKKISKSVLALLMAIIMVISVGVSASALEISSDVIEEASVASTTIQTWSGTFSNGYVGGSTTAPSSGTYKIYFNVKGVTSTSDTYTFALNGTSVLSEAATGTSHVVTRYYSAGSTISWGIHGTYGRTYAYSVMVDKQ